MEGRHSRRDSEIIKACAIRNQVSDRAVRSWRADGDPRWTSFLEELARTSQQNLALAGDLATEEDPLRRAITLLACVTRQLELRAFGDAQRTIAALAEVVERASRNVRV